MIQLTDVEKKEQIAKEIKRLISELNVQIHLANDIFLRVLITQNSGISPKSSDVNSYISETVSY